MPSRVLVPATAALLTLAGIPASTQAAMIDLSTPMSGQSSYVFNADGTPVDLGVLRAAKPKKTTETPAGAAPQAAIPASQSASTGQDAAPSAAPAGRSGVVVVGGGSRAGAGHGATGAKSAAKSSSSGGRIRGRRR